ncbi:C2 calcium-dependent domain-containing protein 6 isoform X2 [Crotalus tigris]|uniref:C2 calcium-dependent domain-containing protein 6 isoform X2 n=1 Tax=Crotalus tigris TaxID=88082 RepID=UPI00192FAECB|nr:C2 calcium-dependent domain-containing protein 6 isoform X2 [Crotalus tigris]
MAAPGHRKMNTTVELPPLHPNVPWSPRRDSTDEGPASTSSSRVRSTTSSTTRGSTEGESGISQFSVSTILGLRDISSSVHAAVPPTDNLKGEKARSLLKMLMKNQKINEDSAIHMSTDIHNLIPCGDVAGLLAINVKQCKDFTAKFNVKRDTYLLIRISIDKIMKCTNPQMYRAHLRTRKMNTIYFGDVRYFSVKKQSFTETCPMRIRNMIFCTAEVQFMFCYGCLGYGYSHQLKLPGADPAQAVAYSMFLRVPPPEDRKDYSSNVIKPRHMDYPAFLSPDLKVTVGSPEVEIPKESAEHYKTLQKALKQPARERLEKMKKEYRTLKTWREKAEYLDQLILKRGPRSRPLTKLSRFKEIVGKIHTPISQESGSYPSPEREVKEEKQVSDFQKFPGIPPDLSNMHLEIPAPVPSRVGSDSEESEKSEICTPAEPIELPALTAVSSRPHSSGSSSDRETLEQKITRGQISRVSETSLSSSGGIVAGFSESGDSEPPPFPGPRSKILLKERSVAEAPALDYLPEPIELPSKTSKESFSVSEIPVRISDSVVEPEQQWPWKEVTFQDEFFSRSKFEPFLRRVCKVQPPKLTKGTVDYSILLEKTYTPLDFKEQEDQDPPPGLPLTKLDNGLDPKLIRSSDQLSILRLLEKKIDLEEEDKKTTVEAEKAIKPSTITSELKPQGDKLTEAEIKQVNVYFKNSLETFLVDKVVKVVALKSLLSKNIENLVAERLSGPELSQELEDSSPLDDREKHSLKEITTSTTDAFSEPDISELKDVVSQHLQAQLIGKLSEKGIIPDMVIAENQVSLQNASDLLKKALSKEVTSQTEIITIKPLSESDIRELSKSEAFDNKESHKSKPIFTEADLYEGRKGDHDESILLPLKSQTSPVKELKLDLTNVASKTSLEIIKVKLPFSTETANIKKHVSPHDTLLQKILKAEIKSLKSFLSKSIQDHLKDKLSETGLSEEELETVCQKLSLNLKEKSNERFDDSVLSKSIQNLFEALSDNEIANLKSALNRKIQDHLSERISEIGLITQEELKKILETVFPVVAKETALRAEKGPDLAKEGQSVQQISHVTHSLQDRFSEEELQNLKSLCSRLLKEGHREQLSELEVKGLASVLQKSFEKLPVPTSSKTGISKEIDKDMDHDASISSIESISKVSDDVGLPDKAKHPSHENLPHASTASEKCKKENLGGLMNSIFEVQTKNQETQTSGCKKVKHTCKKERYRLPGYPDNLEVSDLKRRSYEEISQNKPQKEPLRKTSEPFAFSSFLSAHDIGAQTEIKNYLSKSPNYPSKPPFPVNPQTFLFLHPESEEEAKPTCKYHHKTKTKKSDRKKDTALHQQGGTNPSAKKEKAHSRASKDVLKEKHGKKHGELPSKKSSTTENKKDSKTLLSMSGVKRESMKQKPEKKRDNEIKQKKSFSKTATLSDSQLSKNVQEKPSTIKFPTTGHTKANSLNSIAIEDLDLEAYKHLEKAIERALVDLQGVDEGSCSQARSNSAPNVAGLMSKDALRPFPSAPETPRNQAGMIFDMLNNQDQILKMTPEQLEVVLKILHKILRQNSRPPNNG